MKRLALGHSGKKRECGEDSYQVPGSPLYREPLCHCIHRSWPLDHEGTVADGCRGRLPGFLSSGDRTRWWRVVRGGPDDFQSQSGLHGRKNAVEILRKPVILELNEARS